MSNPVCLQRFLGHLRTSKEGLRRHNLAPFLCQETLNLISGSSPSSSATPFFSELDLSSLHRILSDHYIPSSACFNLFNFILRRPSSITFEPDLLAHLILICRLLKATKFSEAEKLAKSVAIDQITRYPFSRIADEFRSCPAKPRTAAKFFNVMLRIYSDHRMFAEAALTIDHMISNGIQIDERTCTLHLLALDRSGEAKMCIDFFERMLESRVQVSVYSLTAAVSGLCTNGEIKMGTELVEEMLRRGVVRPNVVTFNVLIAACAKWWNFEELDSVLGLMEKEAVGFNLQTYRLLIDGFASSGKVGEAERLLVEMQGKALGVDVHLYNLVISAYGKSGAMESAVRVFDEMAERGAVKNSDTYWALINGFCKLGETEKIKKYMKEMQKEGIEPDKIMLGSVRASFCSKRMPDNMEEPQIQMEQKQTDHPVALNRAKNGLLRKPSRKIGSKKVIRRAVE